MINNVNQFYTKIYTWMIVGVLLSAFSAYLTMHTALVAVLQNPVFFYGLVAIELAILFGVQWFINKLGSSYAFSLYLVYALLNGITMSGFIFYFLSTNPSLIFIIFLVAASMFAFLAVLGYRTKYDMSGWRTFLFAGVWGVFFSSLANIYFQNSLLDTVISAVALLVFSALTVYDNQYYKNLFHTLGTEEQKQKGVILGALHMYINFIMIFQSLLNLTRK